MPIRLVVADDHPVARAGMATMFTGSEIEVTAEAASAGEAVQCTMDTSPDVVLLDVLMPDDGLSALEQIKRQRPQTAVIMFSVSEDLSLLNQARRLSADGYLPKTCSRAEILDAVRRAAAGQSAWSRRHLRQASKYRPRGDGKTVPHGLTSRELQIVRLVVAGNSNDDIAHELGISVDTVKHHMQRMFAKLVVEDRTQVALWALRSGVLEK